MRRYLAAAVLVRLADDGSRVVLVLLALQRTGNATVGGLLVAALLVPHVAAAPWAGRLVDCAANPRRILAAAAFGFATALGLTASLIGNVPLFAVFAILIVGGCCGPVITGSLTSQLPALVDAAALPRAFGLDSLSYNVAGVVGPALGAVVAGTFTPRVATLSLAASAALGGMVLAALPLNTATTQSVGEPARLALIVAVFRQRVLGLVTAASSLGQVGAGSLPVVAAIVAAREHHVAAAGYLMAAYAAGGLLGSVAWILRPAAARNASLVVMITLVASGVPLVVAAVIHSLALTAALFALSGAFLGPMIGALFTARHDEAPPQLRAQVFAVGAGVKTSSGAAGAALAGALAHLATGTQLLIAASWPLLAGCLGLLALLLTRDRTRRATEASRDTSTDSPSTRFRSTQRIG